MKLKRSQKTPQNINLEEITKAYKYIVGVDEVGRGCIAGPVCAGAVVFKPENLSEDNLKSYIDSKKIAEPKREVISSEIKQSHLFHVAYSSVEEIDELNIRQATLLAMKRAVLGLISKYQIPKNEVYILVDGRDVIPDLDPKIELSQQAFVVGGDAQVKQISAASILAKVERDHIMKDFSKQYPEYGFADHKGYGTELHRKAIAQYGVLQTHRKTFGGVKEHL